ncbi:MAG TPA: DUF5710 domain-containing protein [Solirubrobacteraceae bacterium]|jgi:hypothetical protein|nr:DUF5710 domain-containing protein [Solirubrobacteraceae bacterium]
MPSPNYLDVPFKEKDRVKALGARWDRDRRAWFVPAGLDTAPFAQWLPLTADGGTAVDVLLVPETCWKCHDTTMCLIAARDTRGVLYFLGEDALHALASQFGHDQLASVGAGPLRPRWSGTLGQSTWSNGCIHCDALQGNFPLWELFSELASTDALGELPVLGAARVPRSAFGGVAG